MKSAKKALNSTVLRSDLLSSPAGLRYNGEPEYESFCPGILSIILVAAFAAIFVIKFLSILELNEIKAEQHLSDNLESATEINDIYFGIGINNVDNAVLSQYFNFILTEVYQQKPAGPGVSKGKIQRQIPLVPCEQSFWEGYDIQDLEKTFEKKISGLYCPSESFSIQGTEYEDTFRYLEIKLSACKPTDVGCLSAADREAYMADFISTNDFFKVSLYMIDTIISPTNENPVSRFLETDILLTFSQTTGAFGYIKIADYQIETDVNILPWAELEELAGYYIERFQTSSVPTTNDRFMYLKIEKSSKMMSVEREFGKFDDMLSYVGGLFGILFVFVQFFSMSFNEYRYELAVSEVLFKYDDSGFQVKEEDLNFFSYFKYALYEWMSFFNCEPTSWTEARKMHETRVEATEQLDIKYLMRKIRYLEDVTEVLIDEDQRIGILLHDLPTMAKIKKYRKISEFYSEKAKAQTLFPPESEEKILDNPAMAFDQIIKKQMSDEMLENQTDPNIKTNQNINPAFKFLGLPLASKFEAKVGKGNEDEKLRQEVWGALNRLSRRDDPLNSRIRSRIPKQVVQNSQDSSSNYQKQALIHQTFSQMKEQSNGQDLGFDIRLGGVSLGQRYDNTLTDLNSQNSSNS